MSNTLRHTPTDDRAAGREARRRRIADYLESCTPQEACDAYAELEAESPTAAILVLHELESRRPTAAAIRAGLSTPTQWGVAA